MSFWIAGMGTALPECSMSQQQAADVAQQICCQSEEQERLLAVLYRNAGVNNRFTVLPHRRALDWLPQDDDLATTGEVQVVRGAGRGNGADASPNGHGSSLESLPRPETLGPTTAERMHFYEQHAWPLAERSSALALAEAGLEPREITHLITVSCTGFAAPGIDVALINRLGLRPTTERVNVGFMGCHGALNGLRVARALAGTDPEAQILLCAVELCSLHYRFQWDLERMVGNALFADGAAAMVGSGRPRSAIGDSASRRTADSWQVIATGSCLLPDSTDAMSWRVGDHGFEMTLSARVPGLIARHLRGWLSEWLEQNGTSLEEVGAWAVHPGGPRILKAVEDSLGLPRSATCVARDVLAEHGNMSSPTVLFIFDRLRHTRSGRPCVMLGFGPGLMAEAALLR